MNENNSEVTQYIGGNTGATMNTSVTSHLPSAGGDYCKKCGSFVQAGKKFCTNCGADIDAQKNGQMNRPVNVPVNMQMPPNAYQPESEKKKSILPLVIILCAVIVVLIGLIIAGVLMLNSPEKSGNNKRDDRDIEEFTDEIDSENSGEESTDIEESEESSDEEMVLPDIGTIVIDSTEGFDDDFSQYSDREKKLIEAAEGYSKAPLCQIESADGDIYNINCAKIGSNSSVETVVRLYININTFKGKDQDGNYVDLNPYVKDLAAGEGEGEEEDYNYDDCLYRVVVTAPDGYVNLRTGPGTEFEIIREIENGYTLYVYEENKDGKWLRIKFENYEGWVAASQVHK